MTTLVLYAIKHKPTGFVLPKPTDRGGRGGSYVEPADPGSCIPRLFMNERSAKSALGQWLKGKHSVIVNNGISAPWLGEDEYREDHHITPVPSRKREEMEVVPVICLIPDVTVNQETPTDV
jgi:hypothetical protein